MSEKTAAAEKKDQNKASSRNNDKPQNTSANRMSFIEKRELELLPDRIAELEKRNYKLNLKLSKTDLTADQIQDYAAQLASCSQDLAQCEEKWLELELLQIG